MGPVPNATKYVFSPIVILGKIPSKVNRENRLKSIYMYNGENVVANLAPSFLLDSLLYVTRKSEDL